MSGLIILVVIALLFAAGVVLLRTSGGTVLMAVMGGFVLNTFAGTQFAAFATTFIQPRAEITTAVVRGICVLLPSLLAMWFLRQTVGRKVAMMNFPIGVAAGLLVLLFLVPVLPAAVSKELTDNAFWLSLRQYQVVLVASAAALAVVQFWMLRPISEPKGKKGKH